MVSPGEKVREYYRKQGEQRLLASLQSEVKNPWLKGYASGLSQGRQELRIEMLRLVQFYSAAARMTLAQTQKLSDLIEEETSWVE